MLRSLLVQCLIFFIIFQILSFFRETSMLPVNSQFNVSVSEQFEQIKTLDGQGFSLNADGKMKVLYFFAPWCQVCHVSISNLQALFQHNERVSVLAIALDYNNAEEVRAFAKRHQLSFPIALGNGVIKELFSITGYPSYYVLNEQNTITARSLGYSSKLGLYLRTL